MTKVSKENEDMQGGCLTTTVCRLAKVISLIGLVIWFEGVFLVFNSIICILVILLRWIPKNLSMRSRMVVLIGFKRSQ